MAKAEAKVKRRSQARKTAFSIEFFEGFGWPVPVAFAAAVCGGRFEQGDVLFRESAGYEAIEGGFSGELTAIQVLLPPRGVRATPADLEGDRRQSNWDSEVTIEWIDLVRGNSEARTISQGKLLMALWKGDEAWLEADRDDPPLPRSARELHQRLEQSLASFETTTAPTDGSRFVFVVDRASDASLGKARSVEAALRESGAVESRDHTPRQAGVDDGDEFHPTLVIRCLDLPGRSVEDVLPILRSRLYGGATREPEVGPDDQEVSRDRFSVARHGLLETIGSDSAATRSGSSHS
jgi:hypothetical protein